MGYRLTKCTSSRGSSPLWAAALAGRPSAAAAGNNHLAEAGTLEERSRAEEHSPREGGSHCREGVSYGTLLCDLRSRRVRHR